MGILNEAQLNVAETPSGERVVGARRYIYSADSDVLSPLYQDSDLTIPFSNPMTSLEDGRFALCYLVNGTYRIVIQDKAGTVLHEQESVEIEHNREIGFVRGFKTLDELLSDGVLSYEAHPGKQTVREGCLVQVIDGAFSCYVADDLATNHHLTTAGGIKLYVNSIESELEISETMRFTTAGKTGLPGTVLKQADGANLSCLVDISLSNSSSHRRASIDIHADGNQDNNTPTTGIDVNFLKKDSNRARLSASNCDIGVLLRNNIEYAKIDIHVDGCRLGAQASSEGGGSPDELIVDFMAHRCDTFFQASGPSKMTGSITFGCEQSNSWGAIFDVGWWEINGLLRSVGILDGGGLRLDGATLRGNIKIVGGDDTNCAWGAELISGLAESLQLNLAGNFADGVMIHGDMEGSAKVVCAASPANAVALRMGDSAGSALHGFQIEQGSRLIAEDQQVAVDLDNCSNCVISPSHLYGAVVIGATSGKNTIFVPRRNAESGVTFINNRTELDNKIIFCGAYSLGDLANLNGGAPFVGMEVENCTAWDGVRAYYDGDMWVPSHGFLASGTVTVPAGTTQGLDAHGLSKHPGDYALSIYPASQDSANSTWWSDVASTYVVLNVDTAAANDLRFNWTLRKTL